MKGVIYIILGYLVFGLAWIYVTDMVVFDIYGDSLPHLLSSEIAKGFLFVFLSAAVLAILAYAFRRQLLGSHQQLNYLLNSVEVGMVELDAEGKVLSMSQGLRMLLKVEGDEWRKANFVQWVPDAYMNAWAEYFHERTLYRNTQIHGHELPLQVSGGKGQVWVAMTFINAYSGYKPSATTLVVHSIDGRKSALEHAQEQLKQNTYLLEGFDGPMWLVGRDLNLLAYNQAFATFISDYYQEPVTIGMTLPIDPIPSEREKWKKHYCAALKGEKVHTNIYLSYQGVEEELTVQFNPVEVNGVVKAITCSAQNTTQEYHQKREFEESKRFQELALIAANTGMWEYDPQKGILQASKHLFNYLGLTPSPNLDHWLIILGRMRHEQKADVNKTWQSFIDGRTNELFVEFEVIVPDGSWHWILMKGQRLVAQDSDDHQLGHGVFINIDQQKKQEIDLERRTWQLSNIINHSPDIICAINQEGRFVEMSPSSEKVLGLSPYELIGREYRSLIISTVLTQVLNKEDSSLLKDNDFFINAFKHKDGHDVVLQWTTNEAENGLLYCIARDITQWAKTQHKLNVESEKYRLAINAAKIGTWENDTNMDRNTVNSHWAKMLGYTVKEVSETNDFFIKHLHPDDKGKFENALNQLTNSGDDISLQLRLKTKEGGYKWVLDRGRVVKRDELGKPVLLVGVHIDIDQQKRYEQKLEQRNAFIEAILDNIPMGIAVNYISTQKTFYINKTFEKVYGWPAKKLNSIDSFFNHIYPDLEYREAMRSRIMEDVQSQDPERMIWNKIKITTQNGEHRFVNAKNIALPEQDFMISTALDVSAEVHANRENYLLSKVLEHSMSEKYLLYANSLKFYFVNEITYKKLGYTEGEIKQMTVLDILPEISIETFNEVIGKLQTGESESIVLETVHKAKDGTEYMIELHLQWLEAYGAQFISGIAVDIDRRKREEMRLRLFESIITNTHDAVAVLRPQAEMQNDIITFVNHAYCAMTGYAENELINKPISLLYCTSTNKRVLKELQVKQQQEVPMEERILWQKKNGEVFWSHLRKFPIHGSDGRLQFWISIERDITRNIEEQIDFTNAILAEIDKERGRIASDLHDGITQQLGVSDMNLKNLYYDNKEIANNPKYLKAQKTLSAAIEQVRSISHNIMPKSIEDFGLVASLEELVDDYSVANSFTLDFNTNFHDRLPHDIELNLYRIVQELMQNVQRHAKASKVSIDLQKNSNELMLSVKDNGIGFNKDALDKERFGLGLHTLRNRVMKMRGYLDIQSEPLKGTEVEVTIPL